MYVNTFFYLFDKGDKKFDDLFFIKKKTSILETHDFK